MAPRYRFLLTLLVNDSVSLLPLPHSLSGSRCCSSRDRDTFNVYCVGPGASLSLQCKPRHLPNPAFSNLVSGEWFGYEAAVSTRTGSALGIEDGFIPDAFREWGFQVMGFDTVTSTKVTNFIYQKRIRAFPSDGCEADAVVPDTLTRTYENFFAFTDGSFGNGPFNLRETCEWGFTLVHPGNPVWRSRIEFRLVQSESTRKESLECPDTKLTAFIERREADFCDGQLLPGCGDIGEFASETPMDRCVLDGTWDVRTEAYNRNSSRQLVENRILSTRFDTRQRITVMLPRGLSLSILRGHSSVRVAVGWLYENTRVVLRSTYNREGSLFLSQET